MVQGWGDKAKDEPANWPRNPHGLFVDHTDHVWVGTHMHHRVMKFTRQGKLVMTVGQYDKNDGSNDTTLLGGPSGIWVDPKTNEAFISDGYRNRRVIVVDGATGAYKRHWGAYGEPPDDTAKFDPKTMLERRAAEVLLDAARHHRLERRQDLRRRSPRQPHPGVRAVGQVRHREGHRAGDAVVGVVVRAGAVEGPAAAVALPGRRHQPQDLGAAPQHDGSGGRVRPRRPAARASSCARTA